MLVTTTRIQAQDLGDASLHQTVKLSCGETRKFIGGHELLVGDKVRCNGGRCTSHGASYPKERTVKSIVATDIVAWEDQS